MTTTPTPAMAEGMLRVVIESPLSGDLLTNKLYARAAMYDALRRGESPLASHLLYTQVLDDALPDERTLGILAGFAWNLHADLVAVYTGLGISAGMQAGIDLATERGIPVEYRDLAPFPPIPEAGVPVTVVQGGRSRHGGVVWSSEETGNLAVRLRPDNHAVQYTRGPDGTFRETVSGTPVEISER